MQNSEQIFSIALVLENPWSIREVVFTKETSRLDIYI